MVSCKRKFEPWTELLIAAKGQEVTAPLLMKLKSFWKKGAIADSVSVSPKYQQGNPEDAEADKGGKVKVLGPAESASPLQQ